MQELGASLDERKITVKITLLATTRPMCTIPRDTLSPKYAAKMVACTRRGSTDLQRELLRSVLPLLLIVGAVWTISCFNQAPSSYPYARAECPFRVTNRFSILSPPSRPLARLAAFPRSPPPPVVSILAPLVPALHPVAVTNPSSTRLRPARSKSIVSFSPSTSATLPLPNFWWKTRSPIGELRTGSAVTDLAISEPSITLIVPVADRVAPAIGARGPNARSARSSPDCQRPNRAPRSRCGPLRPLGLTEAAATGAGPAADRSNRRSGRRRIGRSRRGRRRSRAPCGPVSGPAPAASRAVA